MGLLVNGEWHDQWYDTASTGGSFRRSQTQFRNWITADGCPGPTGQGGFAAEAGRYHLYVSYACPWAHRTLIYRALKGLEEMVGLSVVHWFMGNRGWHFGPGPGVVTDTVNGASFLHEVYTRADPTYTGRVTVPVLWDKRTGTIVNNESAEIIRMFEGAFDHLGARPGDFRPVHLREEIDALNAAIYEAVNNGVYKAGFATTQVAYDAAILPLFATLDRLEERLAARRYLFGDAPTEADWRLLPTLLRFDAVYVGHFKCNLRRVADYPNLSAYMRDLFAWPGIAGTFNLDHARRHYYESHESLNPSRIVPIGPLVDFTSPHGRERLAASARA